MQVNNIEYINILNIEQYMYPTDRPKNAIIFQKTELNSL